MSDPPTGLDAALIVAEHLPAEEDGTATIMEVAQRRSVLLTYLREAQVERKQLTQDLDDAGVHIQRLEAELAQFHASWRNSTPATDEMPCDECGRWVNIAWYAPNPLWNRIMGSPNGVLCPPCFDRKAAEAGELLIWRADIPDPESTEAQLNHAVAVLREIAYMNAAPKGIRELARSGLPPSQDGNQ